MAALQGEGVVPALRNNVAVSAAAAERCYCTPGDVAATAVAASCIMLEVTRAGLAMGK